MVILFNGAYAINSAGDDASLEAMLVLLREYLGSESFDVRVLCRHPNEEFDNAFKVKTYQNLEYSTKESSLGKWLRGFNFGDPPEILMDMLYLFEEADLVILGAGNFINENSFGLFRGMLSRFCISAWFSKITDTPCMLYGLSASKLVSPLALKMTQWLLYNVSKVTFREKASVSLLKELGIAIPQDAEVLPDPVLYSSCAPPSRVNEILQYECIPAASSKRLAVSLRSLYQNGKSFSRNFLERMGQVIDGWTSEGGEVLFIPQCTYELGGTYADDRNIANALLSILRYPKRTYVIKGHYWPWEIESLYSCCDVALCIRLHGGVFACKHSVPTVALAYEPKVVGFWEWLGMKDFCLPIDSSPDTILRGLKDALSRFPKTYVRSRIDSLKLQVRRYAEIAIELAGKQ